MATPTSEPRRPVLIGFLLAVAFLTLYTVTASHTVILDAVDAAEFQTVGAAGGIPHQAYPLWCIIARVVSLVPLAEPAFRVTFVSIFFASVCVGLLFVLLRRRTGDTAASVCASLAFGLSCTFWQNAVMAEVYALNAFLVAVLLYVVDRPPDGRPAANSLLVALIVGYLLSLHLTNVALFPPLAWLVWNARRTAGGPSSARWITAHVLTFIFPFSLYLITYVVNRHPHPMNWFDNLGQYYAQRQGVTAEQYQPFVVRLALQMWPGSYQSDLPALWNVGNARSWVRQLVDAEFPFAGAFLAGVGLIVLLGRDLRRSAFLVLLGASFLAVVISGIGGELYSHSLPIYMVCAICIATALTSIRRWTIAKWSVGRPLFIVAAASVVALPLLRHAKGSPLSTALRSAEHVAFVKAADGPFVHLRASNERGRQYGDRVAGRVPPRSLIFAGWSEANVLFYYKSVLGSLPDIEVHYLVMTTEQMMSIIREKHPERVYFTVPPESTRLEGFLLREVANVIPERPFRPARNLYEVDFPQP